MTKKIYFTNLIIEVEEKDATLTYTFQGDVDEYFRHEEVPKRDKELIILELAGIQNFNSCGIREWIYLIQSLGELGELEFRNCSVTLIDQINMVPDSLGYGRITSFYAPYYCECSGEVNMLIDVAESRPHLDNGKAPPLNCKKCHKALEFDALEESYFLFFRNIVPKAG